MKLSSMEFILKFVLSGTNNICDKLPSHMAKICENLAEKISRNELISEKKIKAEKPNRPEMR